jgi:hypothetical protein
MLKRYNGRSLLCQIRKLQLDRLRLSEEKESRVDIKSYWQEVSSNVDEWVVLVSCQSEPRKGAESLWLDGQIKKDWERHHPTRKEGIKASYKECFTDNCPKGFYLLSKNETKEDVQMNEELSFLEKGQSLHFFQQRPSRQCLKRLK